MKFPTTLKEFDKFRKRQDLAHKYYREMYSLYVDIFYLDSQKKEKYQFVLSRKVVDLFKDFSEELPEIDENLITLFDCQIEVIETQKKVIAINLRNNIQ